MSTTESTRDRVEVAIIGSGFAGLAMAIRLQQSGIEDFRIYERSHEVGGTWRDNQYPGAACDVQSHLYSYSFEPYPLWNRMFATAPQIQDYVLHCVRKYDLRRRVTLNAYVDHAVYHPETGRWTLTTQDGRTIDARHVVAGCGGLSQPGMPAIDGIADFEGELFHSAQWNHRYDLGGKRVAVVGTGASAIQLVPGIIDRVASLTLFQRTPAWVLAKPDRAIGAKEQALYARYPALQALQRARLYAALDVRSVAFTLTPSLMKPVEAFARHHIRSAVRDPVLCQKLTPSYTIGCKRILMSNDYYDALQKPHAQVETGAEGAIARITPTGVETADGRHHSVDCIVMATGFQQADALAPFDIRGRDGRSLSEVWAGNAEAYKGTTVHNFPNLYLLVGPNTGLGHSSMILMIEAQVAYALQAIQFARGRGLQSLEVRQKRQDAYNATLHQRLSKSVWATGCTAWYVNAGGKNTTMWPGSTTEFMQTMRHFDPDAYEAEAQRLRASSRDHAG